MEKELELKECHAFEAKTIVLFLEECNSTAVGVRVIPSNLGQLLSVDSIIVGAFAKDKLRGMISAFPMVTNVGTYACVTFFCIAPELRHNGLARQLRKKLVELCHQREIRFSYQVVPKPLYDTQLEIRSWYRPINTKTAAKAGFELRPIDHHKVKDDRVRVMPAIESDHSLLGYFSSRKFRWTPTYQQFVSWLSACPTYIVKDSSGNGMLRSIFSLYPLRMTVNGVDLRIDHLTWFAGDADRTLTAAIEISNADLVIGYLTGGISQSMLELNKAYSSITSYLSLYGIKKELSVDDIGVPLL